MPMPNCKQMMMRKLLETLYVGKSKTIHVCSATVFVSIVQRAQMMEFTNHCNGDVRFCGLSCAFAILPQFLAISYCGQNQMNVTT
jgi:hypothetical protein